MIWTGARGTSGGWELLADNDRINAHTVTILLLSGILWDFFGGYLQVKGAAGQIMIVTPEHII